MSSSETLSDSETTQSPPTLTNITHPIPVQIHHPNQNPYKHTHNFHTWQDLKHWLHQARRGKDITITATNTTNTTYHTQTNMNCNPDNPWWGDTLPPEPPPHTFCIISKNVNSLNTNEDYLEWTATATAALDLKASVLCLQEPNRRWNHGIMARIQSIF